MLCNHLWKTYIKKFEKNKDTPTITIKEIESLFNRSIQNIYGCLLLDCTTNRSDDAPITKEQFNKGIHYHNGRSGYEYSNNEFRIIDYVKKRLSITEQYMLGMSYIQYLNSRLTLLTDRKIYYFSFFDDKDIFQIRFYQQWEDEEEFLSVNIEDSLNPIAIYTSDELCNYLTIVT